MRFLSFDNIFSSLGKTLKRFPLTIICVYVATCITMWYNDKVFDNEEVAKLIYTTLVGGLFFLSARVATESHILSKLAKGVLYFVTFSVIIIYYISIPTYLQDASKCFAWISIGLVLIGHLIVSVVPYIFTDRTTLSFRSYNYQLLLRFAQSVFYTFVLFATLSLALFSIDALFDINIRGNTYSRLFIFLAGIFNTSHFLSQYPNDYNDEAYGRPKGLKVLAEYIMIPVLIIYTLILYAYIFKVLLSSENIVSEVRYLIIAFLVFGVFTYLINYFNDSENRSSLSKYYVKLFFAIASPVSLLLLVTVWKESKGNGITDELYIHGIIAIWSILLALYIFISKRDDIKWIPITLIIASIITFYTPFIGICSVTVKSQFNSIKKQLIENNLLVDGKLKKMKVGENITSNNLSKGLRHLDDYNQLNLLRAFDKDGIIRDSITSIYDVLQDLNIEKIGITNRDLITIYKEENIPIDIREYSDLYHLQDVRRNSATYSLFDEESNSIKIKNEFKETLHTYPLESISDSVHTNTKFIDLEDENSQVRFYIEYLTYDKKNNEAVNATGILLYKDK